MSSDRCNKVIQIRRCSGKSWVERDLNRLYVSNKIKKPKTEPVIIVDELCYDDSALR